MRRSPVPTAGSVSTGSVSTGFVSTGSVPTIGLVSTAGLVLGVTLLVDVLRVWLPSIITIFGQAAATPAELLAAFALSWFLLAFAAPPLVRLAGPAPVALTAAVVLTGCRLALPATGGGGAQLYTASVGLLAGLVWLAASAVSAPRPVPGLVLGLAATTVLHTAVGTYDLVWRTGAGAWTLTVLVALAFLAATAHPSLSQRFAVAHGAAGPDPHPQPAVAAVGARTWLLFGPALLLSGMVSGSPALLQTGLSYGSGLGALWGGERLGAGIAQAGPSDAVWGVLFGAAALTAFVAGGLLTTSRWWRWPGAALLLAGATAFAMTGPGGLLPGAALVPAILTTAAGLGICLGLTDGSVKGPPGRRGVAVAGRRGLGVVAGMAFFAVAAVAYYAAYDLGYPNQWVPVGVAVLVAVVALSTPPAGAHGRAAPAASDDDAVPSASGVPAVPGASGVPAVSGASRRAVVVSSVRRWLVVAAALAAVLAGIAAPRTAPAPAAGTNGPVRLVAYNIRMGFGLDGRFDVAGLTEVIAAQNPDVVALSEVDRAWLLNGGHDTLALLARRLNLSYVFAPAADAVWGDAVLTRLPVRDARTVVLPAVGAPTGAQALAVVLDAGGREVVVVSTHLQPPPDGGPVAQARATARFATEFAAGRPLVVAGDLNTEPGEPAFEALRAAGLVDALASARPLPTSQADHPTQQIDHVLISSGITASDIAAPRSTASDHLPVAVTLTLPTP